MRRRPGRALAEDYQYGADPVPVVVRVLDDRPGRMHQHRCPTCGGTHWVNQARHDVAWGRQLTCSPECESQKRRRWRLLWRGAAP